MNIGIESWLATPLDKNNYISHSLKGEDSSR